MGVRVSGKCTLRFLQNQPLRTNLFTHDPPDMSIRLHELVLLDVAETIEQSSAKDAVKEQIILAVLKVRSTVGKNADKPQN